MESGTGSGHGERARAAGTGSGHAEYEQLVLARGHGESNLEQSAAVSSGRYQPILRTKTSAEKQYRSVVASTGRYCIEKPAYLGRVERKPRLAKRYRSVVASTDRYCV
jgi:hypothetical protein